jgi:hypothetical protein
MKHFSLFPLPTAQNSQDFLFMLRYFSHTLFTEIGQKLCQKSLQF